MLSLTIADATHAEPIPILNFDGGISEWSLTSGFFYLTDTCRDATSETEAYIQRRATLSPYFAVLEDIKTAPQCRTFRHAVADESGIYYYNRNLGRLEAIYSDRPTEPPTPLATIGDWGNINQGNGISALRAYGSNIYWIEEIYNGEIDPSDISIKTVPKTGGVVKTLISYSSCSKRSAPDIFIPCFLRI